MEWVEWLKANRNKNGWSQFATAELIGVHEFTYRDWERGKRVPGKHGQERLKTMYGDKPE